jgi:hypothetical protein
MMLRVYRSSPIDRHARWIQMVQLHDHYTLEGS